ncbi:MAG: GumC family protein [Paracoccaceae bacterium]
MNKIEPISQDVRRTGSAPLQDNGDASASDKEVDFGQLFRTLWRGKYWIAFWAIIAILAGGYFAFKVSVPQYSTTATVVLQSQKEQVIDLDSVVSGVSGDQTSINTEVEIIKSRELFKKLVAELDLLSDPEFNVRLRPEQDSIISDAITYAVEFVRGPTPEAPQPPHERVLDDVTTRVIRAFDISSTRYTFVFNLRATTKSPQKSQLLANTLADLYVLNQLDVKFEATQRATEWLTERVSTLQVELETAEAKIKEFSAGTELISVDTFEALNRQAKDTRDRIRSSADRIDTATQRIADMESALETQNRPEMSRLAGNPTLTQSLTRVEAGKMPAELFDQQFELVLENAKVALTRLETQSAGLIASLKNIDGQIERQSKDFVVLQQLTREAEAARSIYEYFLGRLKETSVQQGIQQPDSRVLSRAVLPDGPSAPNKVSILAFAAFAGIAIGAGLVLLREFMQSTYRTSQQLGEQTGYTVLGQIPKLPGRRRKNVIQYLKDKPASAGAEAMRNLRTSVMLSNAENPPQVIMTTSSVPGEGKTTLSLALAQSFSGLNKKVLLIEGDLRKLIFSEYFKLNDVKGGLISVIDGDVELADAVRRVDVIGTDVLVGEASKVNVADLFSSNRFSRFMEDVRKEYDIVLIDTPPVLVVPDARTIAQHVDALLYSVLWDGTERVQVTEGLRMLETVGIRPTGVVLSQIDMRRMRRYGFGGQYGAYSKYGKAYYSN